jgi:ribosomal protein S18 acetylase RimI-like enzyme
MEDPGELDTLMADAWPAAVVENHGGWLLRYTHGVSRRANSVLAIGSPGSLVEAVEAAEAFYEQRETTPMFQISEASTPAPLADLLTSRGYESSAKTWMMWTTAAGVTSGSPDTDLWQLETTAEPSADWFDTYWSTESDWHRSELEATIIREVLLRPRSPSLFVSARDADGTVAAVGQAVLSKGWACVQCLATRREARRRGAARAVVRRLAADSARAGTERMFAAVMAENTASLDLFRGASYQRSHTYSYLART